MAKIGTPTIIPGTPKRPPNTVMEKITQKPVSPVELPRIFGPRIFPSNCCSARAKMAKYRQFSGSMGFTTKIKRILGIAPRNGPKKGMIFVTPIIRLIRMA